MDRRFVIVIGINDYEKNPLDFCVNDAESIAQILLDKCIFRKDDIYVILSEEENETKDISGHLDSVLDRI